jgi:hypothetical protein
MGNPTNIHQAGDFGRASLIGAADEHARSPLPLPLLRALIAEVMITIDGVA